MISLSMIVRNDALVLKRTLPVYASWFTERMAVLFPSTDDSAEVLRHFGFGIYHADWPNSFAEARNLLLGWLKSSSAEPWTLQVDADEALFQESLWKLEDEAQMCQFDLIGLPRVNFVCEKNGTPYYNHRSYPDYQARMVRLASEVRYKLNVHEVPFDPKTGEVLSCAGKYLKSEVHLYHYHQFKPLQAQWIKFHNYRMRQEGRELVTECPYSEAELETQRDFSVLAPYTSPHPCQT